MTLGQLFNYSRLTPLFLSLNLYITVVIGPELKGVGEHVPLVLQVP